MKIGSIVRLNQQGLETIFGDDVMAAVKSGHIVPRTMRITDIDPAPLCEDDSGTIHSVEVDDPYINQFLIDTACFDVVLEAANEDNVVQLPTNMTDLAKRLTECPGCDDPVCHKRTP